MAPEIGAGDWEIGAGDWEFEYENVLKRGPECPCRETFLNIKASEAREIGVRRLQNPRHR